MIMDGEIILRKQAVELYLKDVPVCDIAQSLNRSRQWVHKWVNRYRKIGGDDWFLPESTSPKQVYNKTSQKEEELVVNVRKALEGGKTRGYGIIFQAMTRDTRRKVRQLIHTLESLGAKDRDEPIPASRISGGLDKS